MLSKFDVKRPRWRFFLAGIVSGGLLLMAACSGGDDSEPLVIYSGRSEALVAPIIKQFQEETGINVTVDYGSTGEVVATLLEEGDRTPADVFFAQDPGGLGAVIDDLDVIPSEIIALAPDWARSPDGKWIGISGRARVLIYNTDVLSESELPESIWDLTDPKWKGKIGWAPGNGSFQAMVSGMRKLWGEEKTREWLEGIIANDVLTYQNNSSQVAAAAAGEIEIGMVNHYYLYQFLAEQGEGFKARNWFTPAGDPGSVVLVAGAGVLKTSDNTDDAPRFLEFMLSATAQQYFVNETHEYPLGAGVAPESSLPALDAIAKPDIDLSELGDLEQTQALLRDVGAIS